MKSPRCSTWIETVSPWITQWEPQDAGCLHDRLRSGRPPKVASEEQALAIAYTYLEEEPCALAQAIDHVAKKRPRISVLLTWNTQGLIAKSLFPYASELNLVESVWCRIEC